MSNSPDVTSNGRLRAVAVVLASLIIPLPLLTGRIVEAIMDSTNPAGLDDVSVPLAYLSEILVASFVMLAIVIIAFIVSLIMLFARERAGKALSLPLTVGVLQIAIGIILIAMEQIVSNAGG